MPESQKQTLQKKPLFKTITGRILLYSSEKRRFKAKLKNAEKLP